MSRVKIAESMVDAYLDGDTSVFKDFELVDEKIDKLVELNAYQQFFVSKLRATGKSIGEMTDEEKSAFFTDVKKGWAAQKKE